MSNSKIAVLQLISSASVNNNLKEVERFFSKAKEEQVSLLVLPENFAFMGKDETDKWRIAERYGSGEIQDFISQLAKRYGLWVIAGTLPLKGLQNRARSSCLVFDDKGLCAARYDKIHLFDVRVSEQEAHQESATIERGSELVVVDTPVGYVGLSVCYDLRFPELYRQLVLRGAQLFAVPSAFTAVTGAAHWEVLLRARAIENLCYVAAPNQGGQHENGRETYGHSMIVEPWGKVLAKWEAGSGLICAEVDLQRLEQLRRQFPCNEHHVLFQ
ncbi:MULTISPECIES: carbon-nitrogen hydrolase family protein [unclassified Legionella]|uniref:carbon-nitrogen hydrolase family protein n=1 Tax=unclassified Legionella TaxID=2622702 RepID=UPI00105602E9|nr:MULTISPECIES: carbon-nitrogen hydrolase family protein [unclassified Legionella]MDI9818557.1 carbon-nitrogen hydrolase family protein [Legionella sp. PL877]